MLVYKKEIKTIHLHLCRQGVYTCDVTRVHARVYVENGPVAIPPLLPTPSTSQLLPAPPNSQLGRCSTEMYTWFIKMAEGEGVGFALHLPGVDKVNRLRLLGQGPRPPTNHGALTTSPSSFSLLCWCTFCVDWVREKLLYATCPPDFCKPLRYRSSEWQIAELIAHCATFVFGIDC